MVLDHVEAFRTEARLVILGDRGSVAAADSGAPPLWFQDRLAPADTPRSLTLSAGHLH